jgi:hypothetical protein
LFKILEDDRIYRFLDLFSTKVPFQYRISKTEFLTFLETIKTLRKEYVKALLYNRALFYKSLLVNVLTLVVSPDPCCPLMLYPQP